ncbi:hypothetical protein BH24PSE2_BH24PSE2_04100 [soil metagenome]
MNFKRSILLLAALAALPVSITHAATPSSGTVSISQDVTWDGATGKAPTADASCGGANNSACDNFALTIVPPPSGDYIVTVALQPLGADDWDVEVYAPDGTTVVGSSGNAPGALEVVTLANPAGATYTVAASPFAAPLGYTATASMELADTTPPGGGEPIEFYVYTDPNNHDGGEPSGGIDWTKEPADGTLGGDNGGSIMFVSSLDTLRIRPNDCTAPATYLAGGEWADISVPSHVISLDPIGFVDPIMGRMFSDQLAVKSSLLGLSDNEGDTWIQSQGSPFNPGVDHQTLGGGVLAPPLDTPPLVYSANGRNHGVYYASQDVALAQAGLSLDGGQTFGAALPMWTLADCSGLHGHVKVDPANGAAYVPNKSCNGDQGVAYSDDNGLTWEIRRVPGTGAGEWDPSVSISSEFGGNGHGVVYMGMDSGGRPLVSVSEDEGATWSTPVDVSNGVIKTTSFATMIAGDPDRAAFGFLGTTTPGSLGVHQSPAVWDLYIAMTFDRGQTWSLTNVTDGDPVQRGVICDQGTTCPSNRNLLDFNDIQMDKRGRPVAYFADGCVGDCVNNPNIVTQAARANIARIKSPKGLLAAFDGAIPRAPDWPLTRAFEDGADVLIEWEEPGDGGADITGYEVRKNGSAIANLPANFRSHTDSGAAGSGASYEVVAMNSQGESQLKAACDNSVIPGVLPGGDDSGPCDFEGKRLLSDAANDILTAGSPLAGAPAVAALDLRRLGISESDQWGNAKVAFVLDVQSTDELPADAIWPIQFKGTDGLDRFVRMDTVPPATPASLRFTYGAGTDINPTTNPGLAADAQSFAEDGKIVIVVPRAGLGAGANIGDTLTTFLIRVRLNLGLATITPDNMPDSLAGEGSYTLIGSENCPLNALPVAVPDSATTQACRNVVIDVLANDSDDDGDTLSIDGAGRPDHGVSVVINDGGTDKIEYRPNRNYTGPDAFTYTISDGNGGNDSALVTVTVNGGADGDGDGVVNTCDNCLNVANADQCNTNAGTGPGQDLFGNICDADLDNNGGVTQSDLGIFRSQFGQTGNDLDADLNCNGGVTQPDLGIFRSLFNKPPGPTGLEQ